MSFFIYLLEQYAGDNNRSTSDVLREWDEHGVTQEIYDMYEMYHQESIRNAYEDIDHLVATGEHKWRGSRMIFGLATEDSKVGLR